VVASDVGVNNEIISHGENGFLAKTQDDWVEALSSLIRNAEQRRMFGLRGRELIEKRYSLESFAQGYVKLLHEYGLAHARNFGGVNLVAALKATEGGDGHFGDAAVFDQALVMVALRSVGVEPSAAATSWLRAARCGDGGWQYDLPAGPGDDPHCFDASAPDPGDFFTSDSNTTSLAIQVLRSGTAVADGLAFFDTVQAGGSFKTFRIDYTVESPYGNDTPYSPVPGIDPFFLDTRFRSYQTGAYVQASKQVASRVNVTLGGRVDHYAILSQARLSPRAGVKVRLTDALSWNSSVGSYYQQPAFLFVSAFPQNAALVPWRADHYVTGLAWLPGAGLRVTAEAYRKTYSKYPVASDLPTVSLANIGDTFNVREILFPLTSAGEGYSDGVEWFVEKRLTSKLYGQGNLSFSRTRHAGLDRVLRPGSFDYPFVFNLLGGYRLSPVWEVSARLSFLSGRPFTPYDQAVSTAQRRGVYDLTRVNAERAPDYGRVDLRVDRTFTVGGQPLNVFVGVQNVANRRNFASYTWNRRTNIQQFGEQQGIFPILGLDWRF
jgi:hypothetical protein